MSFVISNMCVLPNYGTDFNIDGSTFYMKGLLGYSDNILFNAFGHNTCFITDRGDVIESLVQVDSA